MPKHFLMVSDLKLNISHLKYDFLFPLMESESSRILGVKNLTVITSD